MYWYYICYLELSTMRLYENGPIPYTAMEDFANREELDEFEFQDLMFFVHTLDSTMAKFQAAKAKKGSKGKMGRARK